MPVRGIEDITALREELLDNPAHRAACGFTTRVPSRSTFSRMSGKLQERPELLENCLTATAERLSEYQPDLGKEVEVDSTMVKTNSNRKRKSVSDPEASWGWQHSARNANGEWVFGYKVHLVAEANYDVPFKLVVTTGTKSYMNSLAPLIEEMEWRPEVVIADRGYDSSNNNEWLHEGGIAPVIHKKKPPKKDLHSRGRDRSRRYYSTTGTPLCECGHERPFVGINPVTRERVYGPATDCERGGKFEGFSSCETEVRVNPEEDIRLFGGAIRRDGPEWETTYRKRWSVERVFKDWKDKTVLHIHSFRGLSAVRLLILLYALKTCAAKLVKEIQREALPAAA